MHPPDLGEHGPVGEGEAEGQAPRPQPAHARELLLAHELPVEAQQEDGAQAQDDAHEGDVVAGRVGHLDQPGGGGGGGGLIALLGMFFFFFIFWYEDYCYCLYFFD